MKKTLTILVVGIVLWSCSNSYQKAHFSLRKMKPENYFTNKNEIELIKLLDKNDFHKTDALLSGGVQVNVIGNEEMTSLAWAFGKQNLPAFRYLLDKGADPNFQTKKAAGNGDRYSVMEFAALAENSEYLSSALEHGGDPNAPCSYVSQTILYVSIINRRKENVKILAKHGSDLNHIDKMGFTPMMHCVTSSNYDLALILLSFGADPYIRDEQGGHVGDFITLFGDRALKVTGRQKEQGEYYLQFVNELKKRGLIKSNARIYF
jgi:uncharacterized protein